MIIIQILNDWFLGIFGILQMVSTLWFKAQKQTTCAMAQDINGKNVCLELSSAPVTTWTYPY